MQKLYFLTVPVTFFLFPLSGMELPAMEFKCSMEVAESMATQSVIAQQTTMQQFMRNAMLVTGTLKNPLGTAACYGGGKALAAAHPLMQKYVGTAMQGKLQELKKVASELKIKIEKSWLPMRKEQAQLEALESIINSEVAQELQIMRFGTLEQVQCSLHRIMDSLTIHSKCNFESAPVFDKEVINACREALQQNINHIDVRLLDMTLTSPNSFNGPGYINKQALSKIATLDIESLGFEEFLKQSTEIIKQCDSLTLKQKRSLLAQAIQYFTKETMIGRLSTTFTKHTAQNLKLNEFFKLIKVLTDWSFGYLYLSDEELFAYMENAEKFSKFYEDIKGLDEERIHEILKSTSDLLCSFAPGSKLKAVKKISGRGAWIIKAYEEIK